MAGLTKIQSGGIGDNIDFDGEGTLVLDSTNNRVGIGTSSPTNTLHIDSGSDQIRLSDGAGGFELRAGNIFKISDDGTERMRIDSSGNVGIGTTAPNIRLHVKDGDGDLLKLQSTTGMGTSGERVGVTFRQSTDVEVAKIDAICEGSGRVGLSFNTYQSGDGSTERVRIDRKGLVTFKNSGSNLASEFNSAGNQFVITNNGACGLTIDSTSTTNGSIHFADGPSGSESYRGMIVYQHSSDMLSFGTAGTGQRVNIDSSGRVLIGTTTEGYAGAETLTVANSGNTGITIRSGTSNNGTIAFSDATSGDAEYDGFIQYRQGDQHLVFATDSTERLLINNTGRSYHFSTGPYTLNARTSAAAGGGDYVFWCTAGASAVLVGGTTVMAVYTNGNIQNTNNSYGAISDIKLKENIVDANSQWDDLKALQVRNYNFKEGQTHTQIGLVAQEVELVSPGLVSESPDRDEEGNDLGTVTKSVNYSVLYMKAVKALQEAMERIETLEAEVATLKAV